MTKDEIRTQLLVEVRLNPKGNALKNGRPWPTYGKDDGGNYNGYVTIPQKWAHYFPIDDWGDCANLPSVHGDVTYAKHTKEHALKVGFDTLHCDDTSEYWTEEQTLATTNEWADEIADVLFKILSEEEQKRNTPYMTVADVMDILKKFHPCQHVGFLATDTLYKRIEEYSVSRDNVLILSTICEDPD